VTFSDNADLREVAGVDGGEEGVGDHRDARRTRVSTRIGSKSDRKVHRRFGETINDVTT